MSPISIVARVKAKAGIEEEVFSRLKSLVEPTRKEDGCISYVLHRSLNDPTLFIFYEKWNSKEAIDRHMQAPHIAPVIASADQILAEPPEILFLEEV